MSQGNQIHRYLCKGQVLASRGRTGVLAPASETCRLRRICTCSQTLLCRPSLGSNRKIGAVVQSGENFPQGCRPGGGEWLLLWIRQKTLPESIFSNQEQALSSLGHWRKATAAGGKKRKIPFIPRPMAEL